MSNAKVSVQITDISSNQEWATDPDMIEIELAAEFLQKAEKCNAFMQDNDISYMCLWYAIGHTFYELTDNLDKREIKNKSCCIGTDGHQYAEFDPEYRLEGCHAKIYKGGDIQAVLPFKHTSGELWCSVGNFADLKLKIDSKAEEVNV